jgi:hypothetical protein
VVARPLYLSNYPKSFMLKHVRTARTVETSFRNEVLSAKNSGEKSPAVTSGRLTMAKPVSKSEFARRLGVHRSTVSNYARNGMPVLPDGRVDPVAASDWIKRSVHAQAGSRGAGVRGAAGLNDEADAPPKTNGGAKNGHHKSADLLEQSVRLTAARAENIELRNKQLAGGVDEERADKLADAIALHVWHEFQKLGPWVLEQAVASLTGASDPTTRYAVRDEILGRDHMLVQRIRIVIRDGLAGKFEPLRHPLQGAPWTDWRIPKTEAKTARSVS